MEKLRELNNSFLPKFRENFVSQFACFVLVSCSWWATSTFICGIPPPLHTIDVLPYACDANIINTVRRFIIAAYGF